MDSRNYELASEFCKLVGTPDLLAYLGVEAGYGASESRQKLKSRRKYMQGMQSNPKYKNEALYLIKHFSALDAVLANPAAYIKDAAKRAESVHLPVLEMTIRGVLAGGSLSPDQEEYLRRNALELGVTEQTFEEVINRLAADANVKRPGGPPSLVPDAHTPHPADVRTYFLLLQVEERASTEDIQQAYNDRVAEAKLMRPGPEREALISRLSLAWNTLKDPTTREIYEISQRRTGPPARQRETRPDLAATAPPVRRTVRPAVTGEPLPSRLEILGDPVRQVWVGGSPVTLRIDIRNGGDLPMSGHVTRDEPWLVIETAEIDPTLKEQTIIVHVSPDMLHGDQDTGRITLQTQSGERASIVFEVQRVSSVRRFAQFGAVLVGCVAMAVILGWLIMGFLHEPGSLVISVDPYAESIQVDGVAVGSGERVFLDSLPNGPVTLQVSQSGFRTYTRSLNDIDRDLGRVDVVLELSNTLDFKPDRKMKRGAFSQEEATAVVGTRAAGFDRCIRDSAVPGQILTGTIRVHIGDKGHAIGMQVDGKNTDLPEVRKCLERQAAVLSFRPLTEGDYATVRYSYSVTPE
jgi:hypothetical protein